MPFTYNLLEASSQQFPYNVCLALKSYGSERWMIDRDEKI